MSDETKVEAKPTSFYECGCSAKKVALGRCDVFDETGADRESQLTDDTKVEAKPTSFLSLQLGAVVRRAVVRHSNLRSDAFFEALQRDLAKIGHTIVRTTGGEVIDG